MFVILIYCFVTFLIIVGAFMSASGQGKPATTGIEFGVALALD